jgi:hypothetical protein
MNRRLALLALAAVAAACGPPTVRPTSYTVPEIACPGGRSQWNLEILDQRADPEGADKMTAAIRDGLQKSFPGCRWTFGPPAGADTIAIEVHRFASRFERDVEGTGSWEAAAEWSVRATSAAGRTLTEFQANEEVSRPNYRGSNNEKESLSEVYQKALERTIKGLSAVPATGAVRLPQGTVAPSPASGDEGSKLEKSMPVGHLSRTGPAAGVETRLERKSQLREA